MLSIAAKKAGKTQSCQSIWPAVPRQYLEHTAFITLG